MNLITALHPKVAEGTNKILTEAKVRGLVVGLHSGLRLGDDQDKLYALGRTVVNPDGKSESKPFGNIITNAKAYESWHCFGLAVDIVFNSPKGWTWDKTVEQWNELGSIGEMFGFDWGGNWTKFPDFPHFQMRGKLKNVQEAKKILFEKGQDALWALI